MYAGTNLGSLGGTSGGSSSASGGVRRTLGSLSSGISASLLYGTSAEEKVVLDIGSYTLRAGFSGDNSPLHTTELFSKFTIVGPTKRLAGRSRGLFDSRIGSEEVLEALLLEQVREVYRRHLLIDSKSRKVAVVEGALLPVQVKRALARVLMGNLRVPQVTFYPSSVVALMTCGAMAGLVVDCGHRSTTVMPVYDCRPLTTYMVSTPMGGNTLFKNLRELLLRFGRFRPFSANEAGSIAVDDDVLSDEIVHLLKTKLLYASPVGIPQSFGRPPTELGVGLVGDDLVGWFESSMTASSEFTRMTVDSSKHGRGVLEFPSWIRERAAEVLFAGDATQDHQGIVESLARCIGRAPVDTRRALVSKILVVGGVADMPNLRVRLLHDLVSRLRQNPKWSALADIAALAEERNGSESHSSSVNSSNSNISKGRSVGSGPSPSAANGTAFASSNRCWIGASLAAAAKIGGIDIKAEEFDGVNLPDWTIQ
ncbi:hypothetical protein GGF37_002076 [Kickxella alabastrina]|nr:hypothetical protein GGF37_002076 [Kickxella alabastrina]